MKKITIDKNGLCDICNQGKKTVEFIDEEDGYGGYYVSFEICKECFIAKLEGKSSKPKPPKPKPAPAQIIKQGEKPRRW